MTGVMIMFAFGLSLVINLVEKKIIPHEDGLFSQKNEGNEKEPVQKPE